MSSAASSTIEFLPLGALIKSITINGHNIVQGFPTQALYETHNTPYFGETIGRVANRIRDGRIEHLNGRSYEFARNCAGNTLHGGEKGWGKQIWNGPQPVGIKEIPGLTGGKLQGGESVQFTYRSPDGDEGFPGELDVGVVYTTGTQRDGQGREVTVLAMEYQAELVGGADETVINMTNHSYFNLSGDTTIEGTVAEVTTNMYLPVNDTGIPTGEPIPYPNITHNVPFTFTATDPDPDDCFVLDASDRQIPIDTRQRPLQRLVHAHHPKTGIHLEVYSTEPSFQFYAARNLDVPAVEGAPARGPRSAFCVEAQRFVDAPNVEAWKEQVLLKRGEVYGSRTVYRAWCEKA